MSEAWLRSLDAHGRPAPGVSWEIAAPPRDRPELYRWRRAVGPVRRCQVVDEAVAPAKLHLAVAVWNARTGGGDVQAFWKHAVAARPVRGGPAVRDGPFVALLQEVFASGPGLPSPTPSAAWAKRIADRPEDPRRVEIAAFCRDEGLSLLYVPSMRNGGGGDPPEDRGNAIVANVPLTAPCAVELPFERQRRVAVMADVVVGGGAGALKLTLCSVHLDNRAPWRRAWRSLGLGRRRQMAGLISVLRRRSPADALVLGGDLNTWFRGRREGAYRVARRYLRQPAKPDPAPTHHFEIGGWPRLSDHLLFRLPSGWRGEYVRMDRTFGSDHYPLLGVVTASSLPSSRQGEARPRCRGS